MAEKEISKLAMLQQQDFRNTFVWLEVKTDIPQANDILGMKAIDKGMESRSPQGADRE